MGKDLAASTPAQTDPENWEAPKYLVKVGDLFAAGVKERGALLKKIKQQIFLAALTTSIINMCVYRIYVDIEEAGVREPRLPAPPAGTGKML